MLNSTKIAHLTSAHQDGDVRIFHKECVSLAAAGYDVSMIIPNTKSRQAKGVNIISFQIKKGSRLFRAIKTVNQVYKEAVKLNAQVYHLHDPELLRIALKLKRKGKIVIYDAHEDLPRQVLSKSYIPKIFRSIISFLLEKYENARVRKLDGIICATPFIRDRFVKINSACIDINNYPLIEEIMDQTSSSIASGNNSICYIGAISEIRGLSQLIRASGIAGIELDLAGEIPNELRSKFSAISGWENVVEHGLISRSKAGELKSRSMAGIVPFLWAENHINAQPNKIFEYMASGLPVICSNFALWKIIVADNNCGLCVDSSDPVALAGAIKYLQEHPMEASQMGRNGLELVTKKFNWEVEKVKLLDFYSMIFNRNQH